MQYRWLYTFKSLTIGMFQKHLNEGGTWRIGHIREDMFSELSMGDIIVFVNENNKGLKRVEIVDLIPERRSIVVANYIEETIYPPPIFSGGLCCPR